MAVAGESKTFPVKHETHCFSECCRVCMGKGMNMTSVFSTELSRAVEELQFITGILITQDDDLPTKVCDECLEMLSVAYKFKTTCLQSDEMFRKMLKQKILKNTIKIEIIDECDDGNEIEFEDNFHHLAGQEEQIMVIDDNSDDGNEIDVDDDNYQVAKQEEQLDSEEQESFDSSDELDLCEMQSTQMSFNKKATSNVIPEKSIEKYMCAYEHFMKWKKTVKAASLSENVFLDYFNELVVKYKYKPSSLWAKYSMLKTTMKTKNDLDIKHYLKLNAYLRHQAKGFKSKKPLALSASDIERFINEAPDERYLATKVALIFGVTGACSPSELTSLTTKDVERHGDAFVVKIPCRKTRNNIPCSFIIHGEFFKIVKKYERQRLPNVKINRFFQKYQSGKCMAQVIGRNTFGSMPKVIAKFLKLPNADAFTGHSFRRAALLLTDSEADITLKRHGGWTSSKAPEVNIENDSGLTSKTVPEECIGNDKERTSKVVPEESINKQEKLKQEHVFNIDIKVENELIYV